MKFIAVDFEFQAKPEPTLNVVCGAFLPMGRPVAKSFWTEPWTNEEHLCVEYIKKNRDAIFLAYNVQAEARCFMSLGIDPTEYQWIDLMAEWKLLCNGPTKFEKVSRKFPKYPQDLITACFGLTGIMGDREEKERMRKVVINADPTDPWTDIESQGEKENLIKYCASDVGDLYKMLSATVEYYAKHGVMKDRNDLEHLLARGKYQAYMAKCEQRGFHVDTEKLTLWALTADEEKRAIQDELREEYPGLFKFKRKMDRNDPTAVMTFKRGNVQKEADRLAEIHDWNRNPPTDKMKKEGAEKGLKPWEIKGSFTTEAGMLEYAKGTGIITPLLVGALKYSEKTKRFGYFSHRKGEKYWYESIGSDSKQRPYYKTYDSTTSRNYFSSKSFLPANSEEIKSCIRIPPGQVMVELDAGQEEFILCALRSGDEAMIEDYRTGDPYIALAKRVGRWDGEKSTRSMFKQTVLALGYGQGVNSFMWELRYALKREVSYEEAREYFDYYWDSYQVYREWREILWAEYQLQNVPLLMEDGFPLWPGKKNKLSVQNHLIQATGAVHLRKTQVYCEEWGVPITFPFHDALYFYCDIPDLEAKVAIATAAFKQAWNDIFPEYPDILKVDGTVYGTSDPGKELACPLEYKATFG